MFVEQTFQSLGQCVQCQVLQAVLYPEKTIENNECHGEQHSGNYVNELGFCTFGTLHRPHSFMFGEEFCVRIPGHVVLLLRRFPGLRLFLGLLRMQVVDEDALRERSAAHGEAGEAPDVQRLDVRHRRQRLADPERHRCDRQDEDHFQTNLQNGNQVFGSKHQHLLEVRRSLSHQSLQMASSRCLGMIPIILVSQAASPTNAAKCSWRHLPCNPLKILLTEDALPISGHRPLFEHIGGGNFGRESEGLVKVIPHPAMEVSAHFHFTPECLKVG